VDDQTTTLQKLHEALSPGANIATILSLFNRGGLGITRAGMGGTQGDIVSDPRLLAKINSHFAPPQSTPPGFDQFGPKPPSPPISGPQTPQMLPPVNVHAPQGAAAGPQGGASAPQMDPGALSAAPPPPQVAAAPPPVPTVPMPPTPVTQAAPAAGDGYSRWNGLDFGPSPSPASQASGPDVIQKLMSYFKNKENPSS
jgi:hypothetical protein